MYIFAVNDASAFGFSEVMCRVVTFHTPTPYSVTSRYKIKRSFPSGIPVQPKRLKMPAYFNPSLFVPYPERLARNTRQKKLIG